ncbi:hypothetical protein F5148DRAFT_501732 [Russula earlei]|uniref:Uncharacterized protein n=1 Tax=Russula earlei TaxID=71964 RepID=A0ACC0TX65_9AGAM|nr:hypothetical protein F5148DRAFT_501732 [Russula earlei]
MVKSLHSIPGWQETRALLSRVKLCACVFLFSLFLSFIICEFDTPYEGRTAPPTPLPRRIHHLANTRRTTAITFARAFSRQPTHTKANGLAQRHSPTFIILPSTHAVPSRGPSRQIDPPHEGQMAPPNATPLPPPSRQHTPRDRDRLCERRPNQRPALGKKSRLRCVQPRPRPRNGTSSHRECSRAR